MRFLATALLSFTASFCYAQNGYEIKVTLKPFKNQYIYLGHYYGKQLPIIDSAKLNDKSEAVFKGPKKLGGGIYLVGYPDRSRNFEILIDKNQNFRSRPIPQISGHWPFKILLKILLQAIPGNHDKQMEWKWMPSIKKEPAPNPKIP
jgi:hypothetical protein